MNGILHNVGTLLLFLIFSPTRISYGQTTEYAALRSAGRAEYSAGNLKQAEVLLRRALDVARRENDNEVVATAQDDLGDVYLSTERLTDAEQAYKEALSRFRRVPEKQYETAVVLRNLGSVYSINRQYSDALKVLNEASKLIKTKTPREQTLFAQILNSLGTIYSLQKKWGKAERVLVEAISIGSVAEDTSNDRMQVLASGLNLLGTIYQKQRRYGQAEDWYKRSLNITKQRLGATHPDLTLTLFNLGILYREVRRYREAESQFQLSLVILEGARPALDGRIVRTLHALGQTLLQEGETISAERALTQALEIGRHNPAANSEMPTVLDTYAEVLKSLGKDQEAQLAHAEAQSIRAVLALRVRIPSRK